MMKKIKLLLIAFVAVFSFNSCEDTVEAPGTPYATFESTSTDIGVEAGSQTSKDIKIYTANITSSERSIGVMVVDASTTADVAAYTVPATVSIAAGSNVGTLSIGVQDVDLGTDKVLVIRLEASADILTGSDLTIGLSQVCPNNGVKVKLSLTFDNWPEEASWVITDSNGSTVMEGSPNHTAYAGEYAGMSGTITISECLASGTYTLTVSDDYSDGGTGYVLTGNGVTVASIGAASYSGGTSESFTL